LLWYNNIINRAKCRVLPEGSYTEKHHIVPRSLGGTDTPENIVVVTLKEHYICHLLLSHFTVGQDRYKMLSAVWGMMSSRDIKPSSRLYEKARQEIIKYQTGKTMLERLGPIKLAIARAKYSAKRKGVTAKNKGTGVKYWFINKKLNIGPIFIDIPTLIRLYPEQKLTYTSLLRVRDYFNKRAFSQHKGWQIMYNEFELVEKPSIIYNSATYSSVKEAAERNNVTYDQVYWSLKKQKLKTTSK